MTTLMYLAFLASLMIVSLPSMTALEVGDQLCIQGFIMDYFCIQNVNMIDNGRITLEEPELHTVHCLADVGVCLETPYEVLVESEPSAPAAYSRGYRLDDDSKTDLIKLSRSVGSCTTCANGYDRSMLDRGFKAVMMVTVTDLNPDPDQDAPPEVRVDEQRYSTMLGANPCRSEFNVEEGVPVTPAQAGDTEIEWRIQFGGFEDRMAKVGDTVTFNYDFSHNVYIHPTGDCDESGRVLVGDRGGPAPYTFTADDGGKTITFACDIGSHCEIGQMVSFAVEALPSPPVMQPPTMTPDIMPTADGSTQIQWQIQPDGYEERVAKIGDTVTFNYDQSHNVYIHPSGDCDETGSILVGANGGPASYTFTASDAGKSVTFACDVGFHCEIGQMITFVVEAPLTSPPTVSPPTATPTVNPNAIEWQIQSGGYSDRAVRVGETISFNYGFAHNVYIHPTGDCDETGSILVGDNGGPASYTFGPDDAGKTITFVCDVGFHCESGQIISFQVERLVRKIPSPTSKEGLKFERQERGSTTFNRAGTIRGGGRRLANKSPEETQ